MIRLIRLTGTLLPIAMVIATTFAYFTTLDGVITWERPALYQVTALSAFLGFYALLQMARTPHQAYPSVFILTLIYQKAFLFLFWQTATILTYHQDPSYMDGAWQVFAYAALLASSAAMVVVNCILFFGRTRGWLEAETDPVPFRSFMRKKGKSE